MFIGLQSPLINWMIGWLIDWFIHSFIHSFTKWSLIYWLTDSFIHCFFFQFFTHSFIQSLILLNTDWEWSCCCCCCCWRRTLIKLRLRSCISPWNLHCTSSSLLIRVSGRLCQLLIVPVDCTEPTRMSSECCYFWGSSRLVLSLSGGVFSFLHWLLFWFPSVTQGIIICQPLKCQHGGASQILRCVCDRAFIRCDCSSCSRFSLPFSPYRETWCIPG